MPNELWAMTFDQVGPKPGSAYEKKLFERYARNTAPLFNKQVPSGLGQVC